MNHLVSVPINEELAAFIGKKGSVNGITFFNRKQGEDVVVVLYPTNAEEKPYGLAESMLVSEQIVISTADVGKTLGEALVAASLLNKKVLITTENDVSKFLANGLLKDYELISKDVLLDKLLSFKQENKAEITRVDIDKAFPVNGIGTVVLGVVMSGVVKVHDNLHHSSGKIAMIRSIQSQDIDVKEAPPGTRVGLAVKGIEFDMIDKGDIFASKEIPKVKKITGTLQVSKIANENITDTPVYMFVSNFSHTNVRIFISGADATITLEKPLSLLPGDKFMLLRAASPRIFASGEIKTVES